ncbi:MAG: Rrf2 family transcriptional regulator [Planctomycetota bacterium]|nr:Rrf2 family transcriptional regulator [Planctomycetota bacterium]
MLRMSKKADYAVFLLGAIARQGAYPGGSAEDSVVSAHEVARQAGLNKSVVANLLKEFTKHGLLESVRGLKGGYRLARAPRDVSLGEILEVVEGRFTLVECIPSHGPSNFGPSTTAAKTGSPLALAKSQPRTTHTHTDNSHDCSLISFCPSKNPMRIVHERISNLFRQIRLDELCSLPGSAGTHATASATTIGSPR